jgi:hypothetical protein
VQLEGNQTIERFEQVDAFGADEKRRDIATLQLTKA